jgi:hypothetical protein
MGIEKEDRVRLEGNDARPSFSAPQPTAPTRRLPEQRSCQATAGDRGPAIARQSAVFRGSEGTRPIAGSGV